MRQLTFIMKNWKKAKQKIRIQSNEIVIISISGIKPGQNPGWIPSLLIFKDKPFTFYIFIIILERIKMWREGINPGLWSGLIPGIYIITVSSYWIRIFCFVLLSFYSSLWMSTVSFIIDNIIFLRKKTRIKFH